MIFKHKVGPLIIQTVVAIPGIRIGNFDPITPLGKSFHKFETKQSGRSLRIHFLPGSNGQASRRPVDATLWRRIPPSNRFPAEIADIELSDLSLFNDFFQTYLQATEDRLRGVFIEFKWNAIVCSDFMKRKIIVFMNPPTRFDKITLMLGPSLIAPFFTIYDALIVHGAGMLRNGKTILFMAPDEGGKTTAVRLSEKSDILCDDHVLLCREGDAIRADGTPWGLYANPISSPLGALFFLEKADAFGLEEISSTTALLRTWHEHTAYYIRCPKEFRIRAFDIFRHISRSVPNYRMRFPKDYIDWDAVDRAMEKG